jgi:hypothetical protein
MKYFGRVDTQAEEFEARLTRALEGQAAAPVVPANFAARVAASLPAPKRRRQRFGVGQTVAVLAAVLMMLGLLWLAPQSVPAFSNWAFDGELMLVGSLMVMGGWFGWVRART